MMCKICFTNICMQFSLQKNLIVFVKLCFFDFPNLLQFLSLERVLGCAFFQFQILPCKVHSSQCYKIEKTHTYIVQKTVFLKSMMTFFSSSNYVESKLFVDSPILTMNVIFHYWNINPQILIWHFTQQKKIHFWLNLSSPNTKSLCNVYTSRISIVNIMVCTGMELNSRSVFLFYKCIVIAVPRLQFPSKCNTAQLCLPSSSATCVLPKS